jgi:excisionase family DNA binding protein
LLTVPELSERLKVYRATVDRIVERGKLRAVRMSNAIRVRREDLDAFLKDGGRE